ncbi:hypothetical protein LWI28_014164 [Acer negundo]|uniref:Uncharacterized protein n=1 Tax=Acer negundo TaxID=4023 RepID=A0AAD5J5J3_ACENE|nr:hypothetical protein LWI28_014164 [Acer negundo]
MSFPGLHVALPVLGRTRNCERSISQNEKDDINDNGFADTTDDDDDDGEYEEVEEEESLPRVSDSGQGSAGDEEKLMRVERGFQIVQGCQWNRSKIDSLFCPILEEEIRSKSVGGRGEAEDSVFLSSKNLVTREGLVRATVEAKKRKAVDLSIADNEEELI